MTWKFACKLWVDSWNERGLTVVFRYLNRGWLPLYPVWIQAAEMTSVSNQQREKSGKNTAYPWCARQIAQKYNKAMLAALYAQCIWTDRKEGWYASLMFKNDCPVGEIEKIDEWFSNPEKEDDGRMLLHYVDACHILTCMRTKICTSGNPILKKQAWEDVAASGKTTLNIALITDCVDKQNVAKAMRIFDKDVGSVCSKWDTPKKVSSAK